MTANSAALATCALGPVSVAALAWRIGDAPYVTATVKAVVKMVAGGTATIAEPQPLSSEDEYGMPGPNLRAPRELVPSLPQPEVTLVARAYAAGAMASSVRLAVFRADGQALIDKTLQVRDRKGRTGEPRAIDGLQLDYSAAVGGIGFAANPLGRGKELSSDELPCIVDAENPDAVAGFCPIPPAFAARDALLGSTNRRVLVGFLALPQGFNPRYFQAAPADQRVDVLRGDENILLEHMSAEHPVLRTSLPGLTAVARLYREHGATPLGLRLESIHIDVEALLATLIWRRTFPSPTPAEPVLVAQLEAPGRSAVWPTSIVADASVRTRPHAQTIGTGTLLLADDGALAGKVALGSTGLGPKSLPFPRNSEMPPRDSAPPLDSLPGAPLATSKAPSIVPPPSWQTDTLMGVGDESPRPAAAERARVEASPSIVDRELEHAPAAPDPPPPPRAKSREEVVWAAAPEPNAPEPKLPPKPVVTLPQKPAVKSSLYRRKE